MSSSTFTYYYDFCWLVYYPRGNFLPSDGTNPMLNSGLDIRGIHHFSMGWFQHMSIIPILSQYYSNISYYVPYPYLLTVIFHDFSMTFKHDLRNSKSCRDGCDIPRCSPLSGEEWVKTSSKIDIGEFLS